MPAGSGGRNAARARGRRDAAALPDCEGLDPAVWLAQRDKPRDADAVKHGRRHFCIG